MGFYNGIFFNIPVFAPHYIIPIFLKTLVKPVGQGHGAVLSSRTAHGDDKLVLSLLYIVGKKEAYHVLQFIQKTVSRLKAHDKILYLLIVSGQPAEILIIIRIRQEAHVKYQIRIIGDSEFESKGQDGNDKISEFSILYE